jgi:hypothetical protein
MSTVLSVCAPKVFNIFSCLLWNLLILEIQKFQTEFYGKIIIISIWSSYKRSVQYLIVMF